MGAPLRLGPSVDDMATWPRLDMRSGETGWLSTLPLTSDIVACNPHGDRLTKELY